MLTFPHLPRSNSSSVKLPHHTYSGDYAIEAGHQEVIDKLVDHAVTVEQLLGCPPWPPNSSNVQWAPTPNGCMWMDGSWCHLCSPPLPLLGVSGSPHRRIERRTLQAEREERQGNLPESAEYLGRSPLPSPSQQSMRVVLKS